MIVAVVGAADHIGFPLCQRLLAAGAEVRGLSRGGELLDELARLGVEPFRGNLDEGTGDLETSFTGTDRAFAMVDSSWANYQDHYPRVDDQIARAVGGSGVSTVANLGSIAADLTDSYEHHYEFRLLEDAQDAQPVDRGVHRGAGRFHHCPGGVLHDGRPVRGPGLATGVPEECFDCRAGLHRGCCVDPGGLHDLALRPLSTAVVAAVDPCEHVAGSP